MENTKAVGDNNPVQPFPFCFTAEVAIFYSRDSWCNPFDRHWFGLQGLVPFLFTRYQVLWEDDSCSRGLQHPIYRQAPNLSPSLCKIQISPASTTERQQKGETQGTAPWKELQWFSSLCSALCSATVMAFNFNANPLPRSHTKSSFSITLSSTHCLAKAFRLRDRVLTCIVALP